MSVDFVYHPALVSGVTEHQGFWLYFCCEKLLLKPEMLNQAGEKRPWTKEHLDIMVSNSLLLGTINGVQIQAVRLQSVPSGWQEVNIRDYLMVARDDVFKVINSASQLLSWLSVQNYCSRCGTRFEFSESDRCLNCPQCQYRSYPKISPCVIVLVCRGKQILLAQSHSYRNNMYSCLAGFIECGETAEEAIMREMKEEVNLDVNNIQYVASQAWPFPHQLMLGYTAEYAGGEIVKEDKELRAADWFHIDELPVIPPPQTIARKLINKMIESLGDG